MTIKEAREATKAYKENTTKNSRVVAVRKVLKCDLLRALRFVEYMDEPVLYPDNY